MKDRELKMRNIIAYGSGDIYGGGAFFIIGLLFLIFMTDVVGLKPILAGTVILVGEIWDAITDPIMGIVSDRTKSKYGRRRVYFLLGMVPAGISFMLLWINIPLGAQMGKFLYYMFMYIAFNSVFTMIMVPYNAMPSEMCKAYSKRSKLVGVRMMFSLFGALLGGVLPTTIINMAGDRTRGYIIMGIVFAVIFSIPWYFVFRGTWESDKGYDKGREEKLNIQKLVKGFKNIVGNNAIKAHMGMFICAYVALDVFMALFAYYIKYYLEIQSYQQLILGVFIISEALFMLIVLKECSRDGNGKTYRRHLFLWIGGMIALAFVIPKSSIITMFLVIIIIAAGVSGGVMVPYNNIAFIVDCDEIICRRRREGMHAGLMTLLRKTAQAIAIFMVGIALDKMGYISANSANGEVIQSIETIIGIRKLFIMVPVVLLLIGVIVSYKFKVTPHNHKIIIDEIKRLRDGGDKETVRDEVREVICNVTGYEYSHVWKEE